ncbi:MAG: hypothetical protein G5663_03345 [Serratia symbiotica]|nr:hypothetical protein [Serratia symbiotica]
MAKQKFKINNWKAYKNAIITRGSLTFWLDKTALHAWDCEAKSSLRGLPQHYSDIAMTRALMLKLIFGLILCALQGFLDSIFTIMKVPFNCPDYTCISKREKSVNFPFKTTTPDEITHLVIDSNELNVLGKGQ